MRSLTEENQLAVYSYESEIRGVIATLALAGLVRSRPSRHQIASAIPAIDEGSDLVARSDAVEILRRRDPEDGEDLTRRPIAHARRLGGFGGVPPRVDGVDVRRRGGGGGLIPSRPGRVPLAGRADESDQQSD